MAKYKIITPHPGTNAAYSLTGSMLIGGPPPVGSYTANSDGSLVGWWRLNENVSITGDVTDSSGRGNPGTFANSIYRPAYDTTLTPSLLIQASSNQFNGDYNSVYVGTATVWDALIGTAGSSKFTFSAWVNASFPINAFLFTIGGDSNGTSGTLQLYVATDGRLRLTDGCFDIAAGSFEVWTTIGAITNSAWTHIVVTRELGSQSPDTQIFINGVLQALSPGAVPAEDPRSLAGYDAVIGGKASSSLQLAGNIADVAIWDKILTPDDVTAIYAAAAGPIYYTYRNFDLIGYGERLSPTGSQYQMSLQGIDTQPDDIYFPSLLPRIRQGAPMSLWRQGEKISDKYFDDTLAMNPNPQDMRGVGDIKVTQRVNFDWEQLNFGQAPTVQQGESYVETNRFNPVEFIISSEETMWPVNLFNLGSLLDHEFDGVIEPFDIRSELLGIVRSRFEGHSVRGGLTGGASETYFGSKQIVDKWHDNDAKAPFFLDAPLNWGTIPIGAFSNITQEPDAPFRDKTAFEITTAPLMMNNPQLSGLLSSYSVFDGYTIGSQHILPLRRNCLAWWRLDRDVSVSGNVLDSSGNGIDGELNVNNRPTPSSLVPASYMQSISTNFGESLTQVVYISDGNYWNSRIGGANPNAKPFSMVLWINPYPHIGAVHTEYILSFGESNEARRIGYSAQYMKLFYSVGSTSLLAGSHNSLIASTWNHVVFTYGGASGNEEVTLYINGVKVYGPTSKTGSAIVGKCTIGTNEAVTPAPYSGLLADVSIWNRRLSQAEIQTLYSASAGVYGRGLRNDPLITALRQMNTGSYPVVDPVEERANHGFYFGKNAGSIVYGDE